MLDETLHKPRPRHAFVTGFIALFPLVITFFILGVVWNIIGQVSGPLGKLILLIARRASGVQELPAWSGTAASLVLLVVAIYLMGLLILKILGPRVVLWTDNVFGRLPVLRHIYPHAKTLSEFLFGPHKLAFNRVVMVEYPRKGIYALGFVTSGGFPAFLGRDGRKMVTVFIPTSPTPFTGWTTLFDEREVTPLDVSVDEAVRFIVSCGVIVPGQKLENGVGTLPQSGLAPSYPAADAARKS